MAREDFPRLPSQSYELNPISPFFFRFGAGLGPLESLQINAKNSTALAS